MTLCDTRMNTRPRSPSPTLLGRTCSRVGRQPASSGGTRAAAAAEKQRSHVPRGLEPTSRPHTGGPPRPLVGTPSSTSRSTVGIKSGPYLKEETSETGAWTRWVPALTHPNWEGLPGQFTLPADQNWSAVAVRLPGTPGCLSLIWKQTGHLSTDSTIQT